MFIFTKKMYNKKRGRGAPYSTPVFFAGPGRNEWRKNMYNVMSPKAEEFISDEEIKSCLSYAQENKKIIST